MQGTEILHVTGIAAVVYSFLEPSDKKALSLTCKAMRRVYMETFFPMGLVMAPMRLSVDSSWTKGGEGSFNRKCGAAGCTRKTSPLVNILGMKTPNKLGMLTHCGRIGCRDRVVRASYESARAALFIDGGNAVYYSKTAYYAMMERCMATPKTYAKIRTTHDMLVSAMMKQVMCADTSDCYAVDPRLSLECSIMTVDKPIAHNILYVDCYKQKHNMDVVMTPATNSNVTRLATPSPLGAVPSLLQGYNPFTGSTPNVAFYQNTRTTTQSDEPIPMVY